MKLIIDELTENKRIDAYIADYMQTFSRSKIQNNIKNGNITVNSKNVKPSYIVKQGDVVEINIENCVPQILPENIPLEIIWENDNMAVVNKPSGMLTHPTTIENSGTLVNALLYKYGENLSDVNGDFRRGILHRLDRNTSGLLMIAKNNDAHNFLVEKMKQGEIKKEYRAIVKGIIDENEFDINKPIGRHCTQTHKMAIVPVENGGKESLSKIKVLQRFSDATLINIHLVTGRTHQIRVHLSSIGHPVYNDTLYGFGKQKIKTDEQVLQSYKLSFPKPFSEEIITIEIKPDEKFEKVFNYLNNKT